MRAMMFLLVLLLIANPAFASVAVKFDEETALLTSDGNTLVEPGVYTDIAALGGDRFAFASNERYALADAEGGLLTDFVYTSLKVCGDVIAAGVENRYGLLDSNGKALTDVIYAKIVPNTDGKAWALRGDGDQLWILSPDGASYAPCGEINAIADRSGDGLLAIRLQESMLWGCCDITGKQVIADRYTYIDTFSNGLARAVKDGAYGIIDTSGNTVVPFLYDELEISDSLIVARTPETVAVMDREGTIIAEYETPLRGFALFGSSYALYSADKVVLYNSEGTEIREFSADTQLLLGLDGELIVSTGQWGERCVSLLSAPDALWQSLVPLGYANGEPVYSGAFMDVNVVYDALLDEDVYRVDMKSARYTIVSAKGTAYSENNYLALQYLGENRFLAETDTQWQMIDADGKIYYTYEKKVS